MFFQTYIRLHKSAMRIKYICTRNQLVTRLSHDCNSSTSLPEHQPALPVSPGIEIPVAKLGRMH